MTGDLRIRALTARDYDEALDFLNLVFSMAGKPHDFLNVLPRMWARDDEHMAKHLAVIEGGRIRAMLGVYPIPVVIAGRRILFSTVGNVATHPYCRGRGYMSALLDAAMIRLDEIGADAARLGGQRDRYARYGFQPCGQQYAFTVTRKSVRSAGRTPGDFAFRPIGGDDEALLDRVSALHGRNAMRAERGGNPDLYRTLTAWQSRPIAALKGDRAVGYLVSDQPGRDICECAAEDDTTCRDMLIAYLNAAGPDSQTVRVEAWRSGLIRLLEPVSQDMAVYRPSQFFIRRWDRVTEALLALKRTLTPLTPGEAVVGIEGWGNLRLSVGASETAAERTSAPADLTLDAARAAQLLFGAAPAYAACALPGEKARLLNEWLPLPLSWITLDRV